MNLTPAEQGLTKACVQCGRRLPLDAFYVKDRSRLTRDGRRLRMSSCGPCFGQYRKRRGKKDPRRESARRRALRRLAKIYVERFEELFAEELAKEGLS